MISRKDQQFAGDVENLNLKRSTFHTFITANDNTSLPDVSHLNHLSAYLAQCHIATIDIENEVQIALEAGPLSPLMADISLPPHLADLKTSPPLSHAATTGNDAHKTEFKSGSIKINFWATSSGSPSRSSLHFDPHENILCVVAGQKTVRLLPYAARSHIGARPLCHESSNHASMDLWGDVPFHIQYNTTSCTTTNVLSSTYQGSPGSTDKGSQHQPKGLWTELVSLHEYRLMPGDALYIPEGWWHQVDSEPGTLAVNFWWDISPGYSIDREKKIIQVVNREPYSDRPCAKEYTHGCIEESMSLYATHQALHTLAHERKEARMAVRRIQAERAVSCIVKDCDNEMKKEKKTSLPDTSILPSSIHALHAEELTPVEECILQHVKCMLSIPYAHQHHSESIGSVVTTQPANENTPACWSLLDLLTFLLYSTRYGGGVYPFMRVILALVDTSHENNTTNTAGQSSSTDMISTLFHHDDPEVIDLVLSIDATMFDDDKDPLHYRRVEDLCTSFYDTVYACFNEPYVQELFSHFIQKKEELNKKDFENIETEYSILYKNSRCISTNH